MQNFDIAAYYWPAYHDEPLWRRFMPDGIGEWQTIKKSLPKFDGHYQPRVPLWGYQDEADPKVMQKKIDAAADHGVNVFIFDWYWYNNAPFLEDSLKKGFLKAKNNSRIRFYLMWANHDATTLWNLEKSHNPELIWKGAVSRTKFDCAIERVIKEYFPHPSYYMINGNPVFSIYELGTLINGLGGIPETRKALDSFREKARLAGFAGVHIQAILWALIPTSASMVPGDKSVTQANTIKALGIDSLTNYQWCHYVWANGLYKDWGSHAVASWDKWHDEFPVPFFPHVSIGWDTNPRFKAFIKDLITGSNPEDFEEYLGKAMAYIERHDISPRLITINSWNEWSEGSYLEPDKVFGMRYLEAVRSAL
ncbi:glycoside hydrolase family 99-like domain-containing protein, partial [Candidatus Sumerlaeota bacterium]|nr:glycoside hydrolase family 99-like domain-containing protein [Candidatus Sumerlaeota bacterium]